MTTETPGNKCLVCGYLYEAATGMNHDAKPGEGDVSICLNCGAALIFNKDLSLRFPTPEEKTQIIMSQEVMNHQIARAYVVNKDLRRGQPKDHCDAGPPTPAAIKLREKLQ